MSVIINHHEYVTVKELSDLLGVHESTIYKWAREKIIKPFTYGYYKHTRAALVREDLITQKDAESIGKKMLFDKDLIYKMLLDIIEAETDEVNCIKPKYRIRLNKIRGKILDLKGE